MDPNQNLTEQNDILELRKLPGYAKNAAGGRMLELRRALAEWMMKGGFAPDWSCHPEAARLYKAWAYTQK